MDFTEEHYNELLGLDMGWGVTKVETIHAGQRVEVYVESTEDAYFCPECDKLAPVYDLRPLRTWQHLSVMQMKCYIHCRPPRVKCKSCDKIRSVEIPWAEPHRGQTKMLEVHVIDVLNASKSIKEASELLGLDWKTVQSIMSRAVERGLARRVKRRSRYLGLDEKQFRKGHVYMSVLNDLENGRVIDVAEGRGRETTEELLYKSLTFEQAEAVEAVAMDMWKPYRSAVEFVLGHAEIVYDKFHVAMIMGRAVDQVRRWENKRLKDGGNAQLVGTKWLWLTNELGVDRKIKRDSLVDSGLKVGRAWAIKDALRRLWDYTYKAWAMTYFKWWYGWARRSQLEPVKKAAATFNRHLDGIMAYFEHRITNARSESLNAKIQAIKANAKGFRSFKNLRVAILFYCGALNLKPVSVHTVCR